MIENIVIAVVFILASFFLGRLVYKQFWGKQSSCAKGCGGACSGIDISSDSNPQ
ncbi:MAG: hypothetical protein RJA76_2056 [Bacteroidota bacterium]|jgi:hypothetical protein